MDLGHRAMLGVTQGTNQRYHIEAKLLLRQRIAAFGFRPVRLELA